MHELDDTALLREYVERDSDEAFATLVTRHVHKVYSVALRHTGNPHSAGEITQAVFVILARKSPHLSRRVILSGWLYQTARLTAMTFLRSEIRRARREQEAQMQTALNENESDLWTQIAPLLDAAMAGLNETDRTAVVLRFFDGKSMNEVGAALGANEDAAKKRVNRAVEKLRKFFLKRGVTSTTETLAGAISANSVQAAPIGLAKTISAVAIAKGAAASGSTLALIKGALKLMAWAKYKVLVGMGVITVITGGALVTAVLHEQPRELPTAKTSVSPPAVVLRETLTDTASIWPQTPPGGLAVQPDGKIVVGSSFFGSFIDPQSGRFGQFTRLAFRLNADGSLDQSFSCRAELKASDGAQAHFDLQPDGKLLISGLFNNVDGKPRPGYARLLPDGRLDESFVPWPTNPPAIYASPPFVTYNYHSGTFGGVYPAAALSDGSVAVVVGTIPLWSGVIGAYRLDSTGRLIPSASYVSSSALPSQLDLNYMLQNDGFCGDWSGTNATTVFKAFFGKVPFELCRVGVRLLDGGAILGIRDKFVNGSMIAPGRFIRFDKNWEPDFSFTNRYEADRRGSMTIKRLKDGKFLVAGGFGKMNGEDFPGLVRLNEDGQIDHSFHCEITSSLPWRPVMDIAVQKDGRIVICGSFTAVNGVKRLY
ncbi:MAG TPA: sigma-70 family RNA polymerase sigma factor, partial [Methylomirabilota bacterium]|nr:sigma-70 family RNA polymerase sigma factor [Methylomirabilota bacterium]